jgi:hypothetical protein
MSKIPFYRGLNCVYGNSHCKLEELRVEIARPKISFGAWIKFSFKI